MKALITGISGFVGSHLAELLLKENFEVSGIIRHRSELNNIKPIQHDLKLIHGDMLDSHSIDMAVEEAEPSYIFHLAGQSYVPQSWRAPGNTMQINAIGTINLLEAARRYCPSAKIQIVGSSEEYGLVKSEEVPIKETNQLRPLSPYGVSKVAEDMLGVQYHQSYGLNTIITRAFNTEGPRRGELFVCSNFAKQIAEIEKELKQPIVEVGNLEARRDFTDVRDMVKAYLIALEKCKTGEQYNICSEKDYSIEEILKMLVSYSSNEIEIKQDPKRFRPSDVPRLFGDSSKFRKATGWKPEIPFEKTLKDLLDYWRERI